MKITASEPLKAGDHISCDSEGRACKHRSAHLAVFCVPFDLAAGEVFEIIRDPRGNHLARKITDNSSAG